MEWKPVSMKHNQETKNKISESKKGKSPWNKGLRNAQPKRIGFKHSDESKEKISNSKKGVSTALKGRVSWRKGVSLKVMETKECIECGITYNKNLKKTQKEWEERKYCSSKCAVTVQGKMKKGITLDEDHRKKLSESHIGQTAWNKGKKTKVSCLNCKKDFYPKNKKVSGVKYCGMECFNKHGNVKPRPDTRGANHHNWKGGVTSELEKIRKSRKYKKWREEVLERDNYTCVNCGSKENIWVDHIKPFYLYPELRLDVDNGRALCRPCDLLIGYQLFKENNPRKTVETS